jgi:hypothetical protein
VALRNIAGSVFSSRKPSVADELQGRRESERQVKARRRQGEASKLSRKQAEARRRKLAAAKARLDRAEAKRQARLSEHKRREPKLTVEDLDRVTEQVREAERVKETQETPSVDSAPTDAERVAQLQDMTREQLA